MIAVIKLEYKTKQQDIILEYLKKASDQHFTAGELAKYFKDIGIGQATVYRQLEKLVDAGLVNKFFTGENTSACFSYAGSHSDEQNCYHCRCEVCGKLIHLKCDELLQIEKHLADEHGFALNPYRTVFYGLCMDCRDTNEAEK